MKKLFLIFAVFALIMASCKEETTGPQEEAYAEFVFSANTPDLGSLKSTADGHESIPECPEDYSAEDYSSAVITYAIDGGVAMTKDVPIYLVDGKIVTQPIQVDIVDASAVVDVQEFLVYDSEGMLLKATPHADSEFFSFINASNGLREITVEKFRKVEIPIDVLCYVETSYDFFGFVWFDIRPITVRNICIFGDICICDGWFKDVPFKHGDEGDVYPYAAQNGYDVVAITKVVVTDHITAENGEGVVREYVSDVHNGGPAGECLNVLWADLDDDANDMVKFEIMVLLPVDDQLQWVTVNTFTTNADGSDAIMDDGLLDFVVGGCHESADWVLPAYLHLPGEAITVNLTRNVNNKTLTGPDRFGYHYMEIIFSEVPPGYSIMNGVPYYGWCGSYTKSIPGYVEGVSIIKASKLGEWNHLDQMKLDKLNYIVNNLGAYIQDGAPVDAKAGRIIQTLIWLITDGGDEVGFPGRWINLDVGGLELQEANALLANDVEPGIAMYTEQYIPEYGEWEAIVLYKNENTQVLFTKVASPCMEIFSDDMDNLVD